MPQLKELVILAKSGRALAQSALKDGWRSWVVDSFGDVDTRACATGVTKVALAGDGLSERDTWDALCALPPGSRAGLVYGSGVEAMPALLTRLTGRFEIIGNTVDVVRNVKEPRAFFARLTELGIAHPVTRFAPPDDQRRGNPTHVWLVKRAAGSGGAHVCRWDGNPVESPNHYFQQLLPGPAMSTLFVADGRRARIIGYNTQWRARHAVSPFTYGGAINRAGLSPSQRALIEGHVRALTEAFGLRGLNSLDFLVHGGRTLVLEINPRPGATCELYEPETPRGMLALHAQACDGELPGTWISRRYRPRAQVVVYADRPYQVPVDMQWPHWCRDLPANGAGIPAHAPVCTVLAEGDDVERVTRLAAARREAVLNTLSAPPITAQMAAA